MNLLRTSLVPLLGIAIVTAAGAASAASFDCARAQTSVERMICADPPLSQADATMAAAYRAALAVDLDRFALRDDQRQWLSQRDAIKTPAELTVAYRGRIEALTTLTAAWRRLPRRFEGERLATACYLTPEVDDGLMCHVDEAGPVPGDDALRYQLQSFYDGKLRAGGGAILFDAKAAAGAITPFATAYGDTVHYDRPEVLAAPIGKLLWLPGHMEGTGNFNQEQVLLWRNDGWRSLDTIGWLASVAPRLPHGLYIAKGVYPDYRAMTAVTALWKRDDGNCCPTGGRATVRLKLAGDRLAVDTLELSLGADAVPDR